MPHPKPLPSREWLLENLRYEPDTGLFWWAKPGLGRKLNVPAGAKNYKACSGEPKEIAISISRSLYKAHRLAWLMMREMTLAGSLLITLIVVRLTIDGTICG